LVVVATERKEKKGYETVFNKRPTRSCKPKMHSGLLLLTLQRETQRTMQNGLGGERRCKIEYSSHVTQSCSSHGRNHRPPLRICHHCSTPCRAMGANDKWLFPLILVYFVLLLLFLSVLSGFSVSSLLFTRLPPPCYVRQGEGGTDGEGAVPVGRSSNMEEIMRQDPLMWVFV
jgi:hypothetical protein